MRTFLLHPLTIAILLSVLFMGVVGATVVLPIVLINWSWNAIMAANTGLPDIGLWQAGLLYLACVCLAYISGLIQIEFKAEKRD